MCEKCPQHRTKAPQQWLGVSSGSGGGGQGISLRGSLHASHERSSFLSECRQQPGAGRAPPPTPSPLASGCNKGHLRAERQHCPVPFLGLFSPLSHIFPFYSPLPPLLLLYASLNPSATLQGAPEEEIFCGGLLMVSLLAAPNPLGGSGREGEKGTHSREEPLMAPPGCISVWQVWDKLEAAGTLTCQEAPPCSSPLPKGCDPSRS